MVQILQKAFDRAAEFISLNARPLERARFDYHFASGPISDVLTQLRAFQNNDGGFGHGIEPDLRMPLSSPFATTLAFQVFRDLDVPGNHAAVVEGIKYFERTYDHSIGGWDPVGPRGNGFPRAVWWNYEPIDGRLGLLKQSNPGAEIVGCLHRYSGQIDHAFLQQAIVGVMEAFTALPDDMDFHALLCFMRLAEMAPGPIAEKLLAGLRRGVQRLTCEGPDDWQSYGGRPLDFAAAPGSLLSEELRDSIQLQLDFEIGLQGDDGGWQPNWSWGAV